MKTARMMVWALVMAAVLAVVGCKTMDKVLGLQPSGTNGAVVLPDATANLIKNTGSFFGPWGEGIAGVLLLAATAYVRQRNKKDLAAHIEETVPEPLVKP